jgi:DNA-binding NarL/FixJ family response regulator
MRILIVDDQRWFARAEADPRPIKEATFGEAGNATEALERQKSGRGQLLDVSMHGRSGLDVLKEIRASNSRVPVLVLSGHPEEQYAVRVLKAGAAGYLVKESAPQELCRAVRRILSGGKYITPSLAEQLAAQIQSSSRPAHEALSNREYQVMLLIAAGKAPKEIGDELSLSVKTGHRTGPGSSKSCLKNNAELMRYVLERELS